MLKTNKSELAIAVNNYIKACGIKKSHIADKIGISQQLLNNLLSKSNFTIQDANRVLSALDCHIEYDIVRNPVEDAQDPQHD